MSQAPTQFFTGALVDRPTYFHGGDNPIKISGKLRPGQKKVPDWFGQLAALHTSDNMKTYKELEAGLIFHFSDGKKHPLTSDDIKRIWTELRENTIPPPPDVQLAAGEVLAGEPRSRAITWALAGAQERRYDGMRKLLMQQARGGPAAPHFGEMHSVAGNSIPSVSAPQITGVRLRHGQMARIQKICEDHFEEAIKSLSPEQLAELTASAEAQKKVADCAHAHFEHLLKVNAPDARILEQSKALVYDALHKGAVYPPAEMIEEIIRKGPIEFIKKEVTIDQVIGKRKPGSRRPPKKPAPAVELPAEPQTPLPDPAKPPALPGDVPAPELPELKEPLLPVDGIERDRLVPPKEVPPPTRKRIELPMYEGELPVIDAPKPEPLKPPSLPVDPPAPLPPEAHLPLDTPVPPPVLDAAPPVLDVPPPEPIKPVLPEPPPKRVVPDLGSTTFDRPATNTIVALESQEPKLLQSGEKMALNIAEHGGANGLLEKAGIVGAVGAALMGTGYVLNKLSEPSATKTPFATNAKVDVGAISNPATRAKNQWSTQVQKSSDRGLSGKSPT